MSSSAPHIPSRRLLAAIFAVVLATSLPPESAASSDPMAAIRDWLPSERAHLSLIFSYKAGDSGSAPDIEALRKAVDRAGPTVLLMSVKAPYHKEPRIVGGYNPKSWKSWTGRYETSPGLFIFDLKSGKRWYRLPDAPQSRSTKTLPPDQGLSFGEGDLVLHAGLATGSARNKTFAPASESSVLLGDAGVFAVESIEIYQALKTPPEEPPLDVFSRQTSSPADFRRAYPVPDASSGLVEFAALLALVAFARVFRLRS